MEAPEAPKHCTFQGCHIRSPSTCLGVDAWWRSAGARKGKWGHRPHRSCRSILSTITLHPKASPSPPKSLGIAKGLSYLHSRGVIHGDLKGVRVITGSG